jgi:regulator of protease activity HflC (stomatin/prohibitin superfamily)
MAMLLAGIEGLLGIHRVPEGHVGVYWRGGALLDRVTDPGFHHMWPLLTWHEVVQVTLQTDKVTQIPCGTSGGTVITFDKIEVVNRLKREYVHETIKNYTIDYDKTWIYDKIHHEINQFCSAHTLEEVYISKFDTLDESLRDALQSDINRWAPGIEIVAIRVTKPRIPEKIRLNYEQVEQEAGKVKVATQTQLLVQKEAETERKRAVSEAEKRAAVATIELGKQLAEKENEKRVEAIDNDMHLARQKAQSDAEFYQASREAEANRARITPELIQLEAVRAMANNTKVFFGDKLPNIFIDPAALPGGAGMVAPPESGTSA